MQRVNGTASGDDPQQICEKYQVVGKIVAGNDAIGREIPPPILPTRSPVRSPPL
jgi:hypothetical protein